MSSIRLGTPALEGWEVEYKRKWRMRLKRYLKKGIEEFPSSTNFNPLHGEHTLTTNRHNLGTDFEFKKMTLLRI